MFQIAFNKVTLPKANKYLVLIVTSQQTKRSEVSSEWTSNPQFQSIELGPHLQNFELKLCEATSDRKLKVVGVAEIKQEMLNKSADPAFEGEVKIKQTIEGNAICVGIVNIRIARKVQFEQVQLLRPSVSHVQSRVSKTGQVQPAREESDEDEELKDQESNQEENQEIRFELHCGTNFYLGSAFHMKVRWGKAESKTKPIKDKMSPVWNQNICMSGSSQRDINIMVCDHKNNVLESMKLKVQDLRVMYPYHIRMLFKEEFLGAVPEVFFSIVRQSFPLYSIMQIPARFTLKSLGEETKQMFAMLSLRKQPKLPQFIEVDRAKINSVQQLNKHITGKGQGEEDRIDLVGLPVPGQTKNISIFKSYLSRKLYLHVFCIIDLLKAFRSSTWTSCKLLEVKNDFEVILRKIYYHGETFTLKKYFELFNPTNQLEAPRADQSMVEQWRVLSNNYTLRNQLVNTSNARIQELKNAIQSKGQQLVQLKKILKEVKIINSGLASKERLITVIKNKKTRLNVKQISPAQLMTALIGKQAQLQNQKRINSQLALRMDCLSQVEENQEDLDQQLLRNAEELLQQQETIQRMYYMEKGVKRQRQVIGQLQKLFQQRQIDRKVNDALKEQSQKLQAMRTKKKEGLGKIYKMMIDHGKEGESLTAKVKRAEETLISLNEQYARLVSL